MDTSHRSLPRRIAAVLVMLAMLIALIPLTDTVSAAGVLLLGSGGAAAFLILNKKKTAPNA